MGEWERESARMRWRISEGRFVRVGRGLRVGYELCSGSDGELLKVVLLAAMVVFMVVCVSGKLLVEMQH